MTDDLVPGTCATLQEFWYWLLGQHGITRLVHRVHPEFCMDGDDVGCRLMRCEGRCPYSEAQYQRIVDARDAKAGLSRVWIARARR
jgi:hypothetical protein